MANGKSGSFELKTSNGLFTAKVSWSETYDISSNTSVVKIDSLHIKSSSWYSSYYLNGYISVNGTQVISFNSILGSHSVYCSSLNTYYEVLACSSSYVDAPWGSRNIAHNSDGTKSVPIEIDIKGYTTSGGAGSGWHISGSKTVSLTTIPRASIMNSSSCSTSYFDGTLTYKYTPQSANFYNKCNILLKRGEDQLVLIKSISLGKKSASQQTATVTLSNDELNIIYRHIPKTTKGVLRFALYTYSDSAYLYPVGNLSYKEIELTIPTVISPSIGTITLDPVNITTADDTSRNILVQDKNKILFKVSGCSAGSGSDIKNYKFDVLSGSSVIATTTTTSASATFGPFSRTGTLKFRLTVTDMRGRSVSNKDNEPTCTCYDYEAPKFTTFRAYRCDSSGKADDNGTYIQYSFGIGRSTVNSTNNVTVKIYYKKSIENNWTTAGDALTKSAETSVEAIIKNSNNVPIEFDVGSTYAVYATVTDNYNGSVKSSTVTIFGASRVFNIRSNGTGMAFGKMAEADNLLESKWPAKFDDDCSIIGDCKIDGGMTVGTSTQGSTPTTGITVHDVRDADITPDSFGDKNANFYFDQIDSRWMGILHMKGWIGNYAAWELAGNAHNSLSDNTLKYRQGLGDTWGDWQTVITSKNIGNYVDQGDYLPLNGSKALTGKLTLGGNLYYASGDTAGLDCQNSDIINANGIYFRDASDSAGESINFYRSDTAWDTLYAVDGKLKFHPNRGTSTALGGYTIYNNSNFRRGTCTLSSSENVSVSFSSALGGTPTVLLTPLTDTVGVIPGKVVSANSTGFTATIGGSAVSSAKFAYLAIYY